MMAGNNDKQSPIRDTTAGRVVPCTTSPGVPIYWDM